MVFQSQTEHILYKFIQTIYLNIILPEICYSQSLTIKKNNFLKLWPSGFSMFKQILS
jgi:hypothetical protein